MDAKDEQLLRFVVYFLILVAAMPFVGVYFILRKDQSKRSLGWVLLVLGAAFWLYVLVQNLM